MFSRMMWLLGGLFLYGFADALIIRAAIGVDSWTVFAQGIAHQTGLGIGILTNVIGLFVLTLWWPLRQKPGAGTVLNILLIGPAIELGLWVLPETETLWVRGIYFTMGLLLIAVASGMYIGVRLGPGPRDGLMTGIHRRFGSPLWVGRTFVEVSVLIAGWVMGGNVGIGTLLFAVMIGPLCGVTLPYFDRQRGRRHVEDPVDVVS